MFRYADPATCPVCRTTMPAGSPACSHCGAQLTGPVAQSLFRTLTDADGLVAQLAALSANATAARTAPQPVGQAPGTAPGTLLPADLTPFPASGAHDVRRPDWPAASRSGLSSASVPKILLGLGALCLLVAAVVFLAVAWSLLGVGGRTAVLILLTVGAGVGGILLARRDLRAGAEAFATVSLGLLTLDVFGARSSGWLGFLDDAGFQAVLGGALAVTGIGVAVFLRRSPTGPLVSTQTIGAFGFCLGTASLVETVFPFGSQNSHHLQALATLTWIVLLVAGLVGTRRLQLPVASIVVTVAVGLGWVTLTVLGMIWIDVPLTFGNVWAGFTPWPTVLAVLMAGAVAGFARSLPLPARVTAAAAAIAVLALLLCLPAFDESLNTLVLVASALVTAGAVATHLLPRAWRPSIAAPAGVAACGLLVTGTVFVNGTLPSLLFSDGWSQDVGSTLPRADFAGLWPALVPLVVGMLLLALWVAVNLGSDVPITRAALPIAMVTVASALAVPTAYGVGLGVIVALLLVAAAAYAAASLTTEGLVRHTALALAGVLAVGGLLVSTQSQVLTALTTGLLTLGAVLFAVLGHRALRLVGDVLFAPVAGVFLWTSLDLLGLETPWRALPMLVVVGAWAVLGARPERELPVALTMFATVMVCVTDAEHAQTWLAVDLTLSGVLVHLSALMNAHRRWLGWVGLGLMVLAQWVRLAEVGVETVEAYTLPLALVLLVVGALRMRNPSVRSVPALAPGLTLALVPSFFIALVEPVSLRALLLGLACLVVVVAGVGLRWSAPLVVGAVLGAPLALREVTHAVTLPQWLVIGLIGVVLTVVGVTWERSLNEVRQATGFLRRLR